MAEDYPIWYFVALGFIMGVGMKMMLSTPCQSKNQVQPVMLVNPDGSLVHISGERVPHFRGDDWRDGSKER